MPIYTRTGDKGDTSLFDGTRVPKSHPRVETYAAVDELNSVLGQSLTFMPASMKHAARSKGMTQEIENIQHDLFAIGSALAVPHPMPVIGLDKRPKEFELLIDSMTKEMPELKNFILPGGGKAGSTLHVARTLARRAERRVVALMETDEVDTHILKYLNRLSDLLFTMARYANYVEKKKEIKWKKR